MKDFNITSMSIHFLYIPEINTKLYKHRKKSSYENEIEIEKTGDKNSANIFTLSSNDLY